MLFIYKFSIFSPRLDELSLIVASHLNKSQGNWNTEMVANKLFRACAREWLGWNGGKKSKKFSPSNSITRNLSRTFYKGKRKSKYIFLVRLSTPMSPIQINIFFSMKSFSHRPVRWCWWILFQLLLFPPMRASRKIYDLFPSSIFIFNWLNPRHGLKTNIILNEKGYGRKIWSKSRLFMTSYN